MQAIRSGGLKVPRLGPARDSVDGFVTRRGRIEPQSAVLEGSVAEGFEVFVYMGEDTDGSALGEGFPNPLEEDRAEEKRRREIGRWMLLAFAAAPVFWLGGFPRFALAGLVMALALWSVGWGRGERRLSPSTNRPVRVATPAGALGGVAGFVLAAVILLPNPKFAVMSAYFAVAFAGLWLWSHRWARADGPPS